MDPPSTASARAVLGGRYEVGELLGRGGMGEVRAGVDRRLVRPVAIKLLRVDMADQPEVRTRFEAEARSAARLAHPNVVAVFDTGEEDGRPFIVMERLSGATLADVLARRRLDPDEAVSVGRQMLAALEAAHRAGVVHRDVKPGNVLDAGAGCWKVADFGIAKSLESVSADLTATGLVLGTLNYLAPERAAGGPGSVAADVYAVGAVLYESLTGHKLHAGSSPVSLLSQIASGTWVPLDERRPGLDPVLVDAVERALDRDPARRFRSAGDMAAALPADVATLPVDVTASLSDGAASPDQTIVVRAPSDPTTVLAPPIGPSETSEVSPESPSWWRGLVGTAALVTVVVVVGLLLGLWLHSGPTKAPAPASAPTSSIPSGLQRALTDLDQAVGR